jgi:hypothetical protein
LEVSQIYSRIILADTGSFISKGVFLFFRIFFHNADTTP